MDKKKREADEQAVPSDLMKPGEFRTAASDKRRPFVGVQGRSDATNTTPDVSSSQAANVRSIKRSQDDVGDLKEPPAKMPKTSEDGESKPVIRNLPPPRPPRPPYYPFISRPPVKPKGTGQ